MKKVLFYLCVSLLLLSALLLSACTDDNTPPAEGSHTVTFLDKDGAVIEAQRVAHLGAATAPVPPFLAGMVFDGWDKSFDSVTEDLTVTALYRKEGTFTVTYFDYSGRKLATESVSVGCDANPPIVPEREGYTFVGWSGSLVNIQANTKVTATYSLCEAKNVFDISYAQKGSVVTLTVSVLGDVCLAGVQGSLALPEGIRNVSLKSLGDAVVNLKDGTVYYVFVSDADVHDDIRLFELQFESEAETLAFALSLGEEDVFDQNEEAVAFTVIGQTVRLK